MYWLGAHAGLVLPALPRRSPRSGARVPFWPIRWQISQLPLVWKISSPAFTSCAGRDVAAFEREL